jgi:pimeloyl-ACP methyl ester carboxylesterase
MQKMAVLEASEGRAPNIAQAATSPFAGKVFSKDGTPIAFDRIGSGPAVILIDGALCYRGMGQSGQLAELLAQHFTVFTYDRRGRGDSGDTAPYAVEREVDDIAALLSEAGGAAFVWGISSAAVLALEAANRLSGIKKLALYEAPFIVDDTVPTTEGDWDRISAAVAADRRSDAVKLFLKLVGVPGFVRALMPLMVPMWSKLKAVAHTLPYDGAIVRDNQRGKALPANQWASVRVPALVMDGGKSPAWMRRANRALANELPTAQYRTLEGQTHMLKPKAHAPMLLGFFKD